MTTPTSTPNPTPTPSRQPTKINVDSTLPSHHPLRQSVVNLLRQGVGPEQIRAWVDEVLINEVDYIPTPADGSPN